jgi:hypothetical protein
MIMALNNPRSGGSNSVPEYQLSGIPYCLKGAVSAIDNGTNLTVDGQTVYVIEFPRVTRWLYIKAGGLINIYFSSADAGPQTTTKAMAFTGAAETPFRLEWRVKKLYVHSAHNAVDLTIWAGLTTIDTIDFDGHIEHFTDNNSKIG